MDKDLEIISNLHYELEHNLTNGKGPFMAAIYDSSTLIAKAQNTVVKDKCSIHHAEINAIIKAHKVLKTYNLAPFNLSMYVTSEPCMMCLGAIMWAGIKKLYFSVSSETVEEITGFDEGYKPDWINQFKKRGIEVHPYILSKVGEKALRKYVHRNGIIYKPE